MTSGNLIKSRKTLFTLFFLCLRNVTFALIIRLASEQFREGSLSLKNVGERVACSSLQGPLEDAVGEALVLGRVGVGQAKEALELRPISAVRDERGEGVEVPLEFREELL